MQLTCVTLDAEDPHGLAIFWAAALGWEATRMLDPEGNEFCLGARTPSVAP